jgi:SAM-dependent methyltransferase
MNIQQLFLMGMKREVPGLLEPRGTILEFGPGASPVPGAFGLEYPEWNGEYDPIPWLGESVDGIYAFHFFEHLPGAAVISLLREVERVLKPGGVLTVVVPYHTAQIAFQDLDHKSFWTVETWRTLFDNKMYIKNRETPWRLRVHFNLIIGIVERNLALMPQLRKE